MTDVFEFRTGKFTPLGGDVLAKFNDEQRVAYDQLASAVAELNAANLEVENSAAANRVALSDLRAAEAAEARRHSRQGRQHCSGKDAELVRFAGGC